MHRISRSFRRDDVAAQQALDEGVRLGRDLEAGQTRKNRQTASGEIRITITGLIQDCFRDKKLVFLPMKVPLAACRTLESRW